MSQVPSPRFTLVLAFLLPCAKLYAQEPPPTNKVLANQLERIFDLDQGSRQKSDLNEVMRLDSINVIEVTKILDQYGWLGPEEVGRKGNAALFLVIQHAHISYQEKYVQMMRDAVKNKKARIQDLALLEDRILMRHGKRQIYGSQVVPAKNGTWVFYPIEDPATVDKRRVEIGLEPMAKYAEHFGITWDLEEHIRQQKENK